MRGKSGAELVAPPGGYFTVADVAIMLGVSERTIRRAVAAGKIGCYRISPRWSWISWKDAEEWARNRRGDR